jgi:hypothetical protein
VAGDFDGDGHADVFWYRPGPSADVMWWGTGSTATLGSVHDEYVVNGSYLPRTGDFNGDHHTDIAWPVKNGSSYHFDVWFGRNDRTFRSEMGSVPNAGTSRYFTGDFNGDGYDDVFTYVAGQGNVVYFGAPFSGNAFLTKQTVRLVNGVYEPTAADFNGDGLTDVYWASHSASQDYVWVNHAGMKFTSWRSGAKAPLLSFAGEFNGDANADYFEYAPGPAAENIINGQASSNYPLGGGEPVVVPNVVGTYTPVVADFDGNGNDDIIWYTGNGASSPFWVHR